MSHPRPEPPGHPHFHSEDLQRLHRSQRLEDPAGTRSSGDKTEVFGEKPSFWSRCSCGCKSQISCSFRHSPPPPPPPPPFSARLFLAGDRPYNLFLKSCVLPDTPGVSWKVARETWAVCANFRMASSNSLCRALPISSWLAKLYSYRYGHSQSHPKLTCAIIIFCHAQVLGVFVGLAGPTQPLSPAEWCATEKAQQHPTT